MDLKFYLEDLLGKRVDLVTHKALRPRLRAHVEQEAVHVPGLWDIVHNQAPQLIGDVQQILDAEQPTEADS